MNPTTTNRNGVTTMNNHTTTNANHTGATTMKSTLSFIATVVVGLLLAETVAADTSLKAPVDLSKLTPLQRAWQSASSEARKLMSEKLGEEGAAQWARAQGYEAVLDHTQKEYLHGMDQIYRTPDGKIVSIEAKGGTSTPSLRKGLTQGTPECAVESAADMLKSPKTTPAEKKAAALLLEAAKEGKLETVVIHTDHVYGEPQTPKIKEGHHFPTDHPKSKAVVPRAAHVLDELRDSINAARNGADSVAKQVALETDDALRGGSLAFKFLKPLAKVAGPVLVIVDLYSASQEYQAIEAEFDQGQITEDERLNRHVQQVTGTVGGWAGAASGASAGAVFGATMGGTVCSVVPVLGNAAGATVGGVVGGIVGGVCGYMAGDDLGRAGADYVLGDDVESAVAPAQ